MLLNLPVDFFPISYNTIYPSIMDAIADSVSGTTDAQLKPFPRFNGWNLQLGE